LQEVYLVVFKGLYLEFACGEGEQLGVKQMKLQVTCRVFSDRAFLWGKVIQVCSC